MSADMLYWYIMLTVAIEKRAMTKKYPDKEYGASNAVQIFALEISLDGRVADMIYMLPIIAAFFFDIMNDLHLLAVPIYSKPCSAIHVCSLCSSSSPYKSCPCFLIVSFLLITATSYVLYNPIIQLKCLLLIFSVRRTEQFYVKRFERTMSRTLMSNGMHRPCSTTAFQNLGIAVHIT